MELHFNVSGSDRKKMVQAISKELNTKATYLGAPTMAYRIGNYTVSRDGCLAFPDDISLEETSAVIDSCVAACGSPAEWDVNLPQEENGLTVSMPRSTFTDTQLDNLTRLIDAKAPLLKKALAVDELPVLVTDSEVSFPWFSSDLDADHCAAYTALISSICQMAKEAKRVTAKEKEAVNPKYEFRCFLLRLGFIGDQYKAGRKILLENLSGSSAFKSGAKKGGEQ